MAKSKGVWNLICAIFQANKTIQDYEKPYDISYRIEISDKLIVKCLCIQIQSSWAALNGHYTIQAKSVVCVGSDANQPYWNEKH
jgi:hypothetical protein